MRHAKMVVVLLGIVFAGCNNSSSPPYTCNNYPATCAPYEPKGTGVGNLVVTISSNDPACNAGLDLSNAPGGGTEVTPPENCGVLLSATSPQKPAPKPTQIMLPPGQTLTEYGLTIVATGFDKTAGVEEIEIDGEVAVCNMDGSAISTQITNYPNANGNSPPALGIQDNSGLSGQTIIAGQEYETLPISSSTTGSVNVTQNMPGLAQVNIQFWGKAKNAAFTLVPSTSIGFWATTNNQKPSAYCSKATSPFLGVSP